MRAEIPGDSLPRIDACGEPVRTNRGHLAVQGFLIEVADPTDPPDVLESLRQEGVRQVVAIRNGHSNLPGILARLSRGASIGGPPGRRQVPPARRPSSAQVDGIITFWAP